MKRTPNQDTNGAKNKIVLLVGSFEQKEEITLYNFEKVDRYHDTTTETIALRVLCGNRFYYYPLRETVIKEIVIF